MATAFVKATTGTGVKAATSFSLPWTATAGNALVAVVTASNGGAAAVATPAGWTAAGLGLYSSTSPAPGIYWFYQTGCGASGTLSVTTGTSSDLDAVILEYSGAAVAWASNANINTTPQSNPAGTSVAAVTATTAAGGLAVTALNAAGVPTITTTLNGYTAALATANTTFGTSGGSAITNMTAVVEHALSTPAGTLTSPSYALSASEAYLGHGVYFPPAATSAVARRIGKYQVAL